MTGEVKISTNDIETIKKDKSVQVITQNIIKSQPQLESYHPVSTETISYGEIKQTTVILKNEEKVTVQATTIYNTTSEKVQVVSVKHIEDVHEIVHVPIKTIPSSAITVAIKKYPEISQIVTSVQ